ncbi:MAG TPA: cob(I)yrinic acid a,c-diamide adenosyltransferase, partial [Nitrososphaerales archaeon]|nr:cob(I)yrinic acid a,c-diamide adenosyltransferase [Nitrososphaerales archaeon]
IGGELATISNDKKLIKRIEKKDVIRLENSIDFHSDKLEPLENFILPGGSTIAALFHLGRTICRRAERNIVDLSEVEDINEEIIVYLNRLSDLLFILARISNKILDVKDIKWN